MEFESVLLEMISQINKKIDDVEDTLNDLVHQKEALLLTRQTYLDMKGGERPTKDLLLSSEDVKDKSQNEIMKMIAERNNKVLVVRDAIQIMKKLNVFGNPDNPDPVVYSTLKRNKEWAKVAGGIYRLDGVNEEHKNEPQKANTKNDSHDISKNKYWKYADDIKGMTQRSALIHLAIHNNDMIYVGDAADIMVHTGIMKGDPKNARPHVYELMKRIGDFKNIDRGCYEYRPPNTDNPHKINSEEIEADVAPIFNGIRNKMF